MPAQAQVINPESELFFPVVLKPLETISPDHTSLGLQAVCRVNGNGQPDTILAIHKRQYKLVTNETVYSAFETALRNSGLDMEDVGVVDSLAYEGGRALRTYRFPKHQVDIGGGDPVMLQLRVINSYDGTSRFSAMFGAYRFICSNGLVIGQAMLNMQQKHTAALNVDRMAAGLRGSAALFVQTTEMWKEWKQRPCPANIAQATIKRMNVTEAVKEQILRTYEANAPKEGKSVWALYNAMTQWATHQEVKPSATGNISAIMLGREERVRAVLSAPLFQIAA